MSKTITIRLDEDTYDLIKSAAEGQMRSISNFVEFATVSYLTAEAFVSDEEMSELMSDTELVQTLKKAKADVQSERYKIVGYVPDCGNRDVSEEAEEEQVASDGVSTRCRNRVPDAHEYSYTLTLQRVE